MNLLCGIVMAATVAIAPAVWAAEIHVAASGNDSNVGSPAAPLKTIQKAADLAQPGDEVVVHAGIYRERVNPVHGGESDSRRIVYRAADGEKVTITGSEVVTGWKKVQGDTWTVTLPDSFFGVFNPFADVIHGDWFMPQGKVHHTAAVYLNGNWLAEGFKKEDVLAAVKGEPRWFAEVDGKNTTIWAQFPGADPNQQTTEVNVRRTVFYPEKEGINYITVKGFDLRDAAAPWAPPTAEQMGVIGTHWSKGWIIEKNTVSHSACAGISLGKYGDEFDNKAESAEGYVGTIKRALAHGWNGQTVGHHLVKDNIVSDCGQAGIVGSMGAVYSTITGNTVHDVFVRRPFWGAEMAGIKLHGAVDVTISHNEIYNSILAIWLDWMAQGTRVTANCFHDNGRDLFVEVDHGPFVVDNNLFLSPRSVSTRSQGGAYVNNLFAGTFEVTPYDSRQTPYLKAHGTEIAGFHDNPTGDDRYFNNVFVGKANIDGYGKSKLPIEKEGNVFLPDDEPKISKEDGSLYLELKVGDDWGGRKVVTGEMLGKTAVAGLPFENPDGTPVQIDKDYFGKERDEKGTMAGPFEGVKPGDLKLKIR